MIMYTAVKFCVVIGMVVAINTGCSSNPPKVAPAPVSGTGATSGATGSTVLTQQTPAGGKLTKEVVLAALVRKKATRGVKLLAEEGTNFTTKNTQGLNYFIEFAPNSAKVTPTEELQVIASALQVLEPTVPIEVLGHTDSTGTVASNMTLSRNRAEAVRKWLEAEGVGSGILKAKGVGPTQPIADNGTVEGRRKNRRVEFVRQKVTSQ